MKVSFKIGAITLNADTPAYEQVLRAVTARDGVQLEAPEIKECKMVPAKTIEFHMHESQVDIECKVGEVAGIYKEIVPMFKDLMVTIAAIRNSDNNCKVAISAANAVNARTTAATAAFVADQQGRRTSN